MYLILILLKHSLILDNIEVFNMYGDGYYSQSEEDKILEKYFEGFVGNLLDIGAYNPTVFSNSRKLIELGWNATLVEASPRCFKTIKEFYDGHINVKLVNVALSSIDGDMTFYDSEGALGTGVIEHYLKWRNLQLDYEKIKIPSLSWKTFRQSNLGPFHFINIDIEGMDWEVLSQINLNDTETKVVCMRQQKQTSML